MTAARTAGGAAGIFDGGLMPSVMATIALRSPAERRGWIFGLTATATSLGNAVRSRPAGAAAASAFGLRSSFIITGIVLLLAALWVAVALGVRSMPGRGRWGQRRWQWRAHPQIQIRALEAPGKDPSQRPAYDASPSASGTGCLPAIGYAILPTRRDKHQCQANSGTAREDLSSDGTSSRNDIAAG